MSSPTPHPKPPAQPGVPATVKYSLPELLAEIDQEKISGAFGMEKLQQSDIAKVFENSTHRRRV